MPKKREIKVKLTRPLKIQDATFKLLAEEFIEWYERGGCKKQQAKQAQPEKSPEKQLGE